MTLTQTIILSIIEGLTEFLPVSSTGHLIITSHLMGIPHSEFVKTFEIAIQLGAILSVVVLYFRRFIAGVEIYKKLAIAFLPTGLFGLLAYKTIKLYLFNPFVVATMLLVGGIALIMLDRWTAKRTSVYKNLEDLSIRGALTIGAIQCLSMVPGVSRAAATIIGGVVAGYDRKQATEFSFLLAVPTMFTATAYDLLKTASDFTNEQWYLLLTGAVVSFVSAGIAIKFLIYVVANYGFKHFGYYRIVIGVLFFAIHL